MGWQSLGHVLLVQLLQLLLELCQTDSGCAGFPGPDGSE